MRDSIGAACAASTGTEYMLNYITTSGYRVLLLELVPRNTGVTEEQLTAPAIFPSFQTLHTNRALLVLKSTNPVAVVPSLPAPPSIPTK